MCLLLLLFLLASLSAGSRLPLLLRLGASAIALLLGALALAGGDPAVAVAGVEALALSLLAALVAFAHFFARPSETPPPSSRADRSRELWRLVASGADVLLWLAVVALLYESEGHRPVLIVVLAVAAACFEGLEFLSKVARTRARSPEPAT